MQQLFISEIFGIALENLSQEAFGATAPISEYSEHSGDSDFQPASDEGFLVPAPIQLYGAVGVNQEVSDAQAATAAAQVRGSQRPACRTLRQHLRLQI